MGIEPFLGLLDIGSGGIGIDAPLVVGRRLAVGLGEILHPLQAVFLADLGVPGRQRIGGIPLQLVVEVHADDVDVGVARIGRGGIHAEVAEVDVPFELELARDRAERIDEMPIGLDELLLVPLGRPRPCRQVELLADAHIDRAVARPAGQHGLGRFHEVGVVVSGGGSCQRALVREHRDGPGELGGFTAEILDPGQDAVLPVGPVHPVGMHRDEVDRLAQPVFERANSRRRCAGVYSERRHDIPDLRLRIAPRILAALLPVEIRLAGQCRSSQAPPWFPVRAGAGILPKGAGANLPRPEASAISRPLDGVRA